MDNNQNQRNNNPLGDGSNSPRKQNIILLLVAALVTMICMTYFLRAFSENTTQEKTYSEFIAMVENGEVKSVVIEDDRIVIIPVSEEDEEHSQPSFVGAFGGGNQITYYTGKAEEDSELTKRMLDAGVDVKRSS